MTPGSESGIEKVSAPMKEPSDYAKDVCAVLSVILAGGCLGRLAINQPRLKEKAWKGGPPRTAQNQHYTAINRDQIITRMGYSLLILGPERKYLWLS